MGSYGVLGIIYVKRTISEDCLALILKFPILTYVLNKFFQQNDSKKYFIIIYHTRSARKVSGLPLYIRAGVILHHRAGGILQSNPHLIE